MARVIAMVQNPEVVEGSTNIGPRLRALREKSGKSLRAVARELGVSPAFMSQMENGKSQPSVATLYALGRLFDEPIDSFFGVPEPERPRVVAGGEPVSRSDFTSPSNVDWQDGEIRARISAVRADQRTSITMKSGVRWERLAATPDPTGNFVEVVYEPGATSNEEGQPMIHQGYEYGYALRGELHMLIGDVALVLKAGDSIGFDSAIPHLFRNTGSEPFHGIWFVQAASPRH